MRGSRGTRSRGATDEVHDDHAGHATRRWRRGRRSTSTRSWTRWVVTTTSSSTRGVLVAAEGLDDPKEGIVVDFSSQPPVATDGPYGETKELFNGFWILDVASKEEAVEWAKRVPLGGGTKIEIRRVPSITEFRRTTSGSRRSARGGSRPASCDAADPVRTARRPHRSPGGRGRVAHRVGADRRRARPLHRRLRDGRGPRAGGARRGAGLVAARRRTPQPRRLAAHRRPAAGHRRVPAAGRPSTRGTPRWRPTWTRARPSPAPRPGRNRRTTCSTTPSGSTTTSSP